MSLGVEEVLSKIAVDQDSPRDWAHSTTRFAEVLERTGYAKMYSRRFDEARIAIDFKNTK